VVKTGRAKRSLVGFAMGLALALTASAARADMITPRAAQHALVAAGYSGVGGVTRSGSYYFAVALSQRGQRVRVGIDGRSGQIASVTPIRPGGSLTPTARRPKAFEPPRIDAVTPPLMFDPYVPPSDAKPIGVPTFPFSADVGRKLPESCRFLVHAAGC
jgi:hypothetical protein